MASGLLLKTSAGVRAWCGSPARFDGSEKAPSYARSDIFGENPFAGFNRSSSSAGGHGIHTSPALLCVAVVWWSDAARKLQPDWKVVSLRFVLVLKNIHIQASLVKKKAHLMRVEKLQGGSVPKSGLEDESVEEYMLQWMESLKARTKELVSAGLTPEVIIGRTAMLGFLAATTVEFETGKSVLQQLTIRGEVASAVVAITVAAMSLLLHKKYTEENGSSAIFNPFGLFTPTAERLNGQAAMLGFTLLVATEVAKGSALF